MKKDAPARSTLTVGLDARVELIAALGAAAAPSAPADAAARRAWSALPRGHAACRLYASMTEKDWRHRTPAMIILDFGAPPALEVVAHKDHYANAGKDDAVSRLLPALRDFASMPATRAYLAALPARHRAAVAKVRARLARAPYQPAAEAYLGVPLPHDYAFVLSPLVRGVNCQNVLYRRPGGRCAIYSLSSLDAAAVGEPHDFQRTAWHEVCHTVVDGWTQEHAALFEPLAGLYALMTGRAKAQYCGPPGWLHMVDEHVIRAVCARLEAGLRGEDAGRRELEKQRREGFALIGPVYESLRLYERERARFPALRDYYPQLAAMLRRFAGGRGR